MLHAMQNICRKTILKYELIFGDILLIHRLIKRSVTYHTYAPLPTFAGL
jgi:hypothetical protein